MMRLAIARKMVGIAALTLSASIAFAIPAAASGDQTRITLTVRGCEGCVIQAFGGKLRADGSPWESAKSPVSDGRVVLTVPTRQTRGMLFEINTADGSAAGIDAMPDIVMSYDGIAVGSRVTPTQAKRATKAVSCWAGTKEAAVTLGVRVTRFKAMGTMNESVTTLRAWASPSQPGRGEMQPAPRGQAADQNPGYCAEAR
jgi:hypothetical protein